LNTSKEVFEKLNRVDIKPFVKQKNGLSYISWAVAWRMIIELFPDATYEFVNYDGVPFKMTPYGAFVSTTMTIGGVTRPMTLPVLDGANKSLKDKAYEYTTKHGSKSVAEITAFDINKAQMRCLVKNASVFGLGIDLYIGYDLPDDLHLEDRIDNVQEIKKLLKEKGWRESDFLAQNQIRSLSSLDYDSQLYFINQLKAS
jgi:hypothetical protein